MIELVNICKSINGKKILDRVSFKVDKGQRMVILGPSGSGKTTILRLIAGFETPDKGEIKINGECVNTLAPYKRNIGMVFQDLALWPHMSVKENIGFGLDPKRFSKRDREKKIKEILDSVGLTRHTVCYPAQLSGGEQQRVALARALVLEPKILLLDEPLSDLDLQLREELQKVILELQQRLKITAIYVTHNQVEVGLMAEQIVVINEGKVEQKGSPEELYNNPQTEFIKKFMRIQIRE